MTRKVTSCLNAQTTAKRRALNSFSIATRRLLVQTQKDKATIETGVFAGKEIESEEWNTISSSDESEFKSGIQLSTPTNTSTCSAEDNHSSYVGIISGKVRALANCTPSLYDRDSLPFKKGDIVKHKIGIWKDIGQEKVGRKFINVEVEERKCKHRHLRNDIDWLKLQKKPEFLEELQIPIRSEDYTNTLIGYDESDTLTMENKKIDLTNKNPDHKSTVRGEILQDVDDSSENETFFQPTITSTPKKINIGSSNLINGPIKTTKALSRIFDSFGSERFFQPTITSTPKKINIGTSNLINGPKNLAEIFDSVKLISEPVSELKESPQKVLSEKLMIYRRKMAKVPVCDIIKTKCNFPF